MPKAEAFFKTKLDEIVVFFYFFLLFSQKILLITTDLGRHIKNGEYLFKDLAVLTTNFYSYTQPNFAFINHHWGYGALMYFFHVIGGFSLLTALNAFIYSLAVLFAYKGAKKIATKPFALSAAFLVAPLLATRIEVRPEMLSYLFISLFIYFLLKYKESSIGFKYLAIFLLFIQLIWVNTHIFFIFGPLVVGAFMVELLVNRKFKDLKKTSLLFAGLLLFSFVNPFLLKGFLAPLGIFNNYGYMLVEDQSVFFLIKRFSKFEHYYFLFLLIAAAIVFAIKIRKNFINNLFLGLVFVAFSFLAVNFIRALPLFSIAFMYFLPLQLIKYNKLTTLSFKDYKPILIAFVLLLVLLPTAFSPFNRGRFGYGLVSGSMQSLQFFENNNIKGPVFNNYDIGGYLIYGLFSKTRVFVDNRPEAYSSEFLHNKYVSMQEDEEVWKNQSEEYNINSIFFYRRDFTPWAQPFLIERIKDKNWVPVYVDAYTIILVKNTQDNSELIAKYALPSEIFKITQ
jgi:hypothetical protein